jgi:hypothetical protein
MQSREAEQQGRVQAAVSELQREVEAEQQQRAAAEQVWMWDLAGSSGI